MLALRWFIEPLQISVLAQIFDFTFPFMKLLRLASSKEECKAFDFREELCVCTERYSDDIRSDGWGILKELWG